LERAAVKCCISVALRMGRGHAGKFDVSITTNLLRVVADADGVTVLEREKVESLLPLAKQKVDDEAARIAAIKRGETESKWLPGALRAAGVLMEGETL
jgi:hypothetical protein